MLSPSENPVLPFHRRHKRRLNEMKDGWNIVAIWLSLCLWAHGQAVGPQGGASAGELLAAGEQAYNRGDWNAASEAFLKFTADYGGLPGTEAAVGRVKPLLALCMVRQGKWNEAMPLLEESLQREGLDAALRSDLVFFSGLSAMRTGKPDVARKHLGAAFNDASMERSKRMEALILGGMSYVMEKNWKEAVTFFQRYGPEITRYSPEGGARANLLVMHALMEEQRWDEAVQVAKTLHGSMDAVRQVVTYSSMLVRTGDHFLNEGQPHQAISILRMVLPKQEILRLQQARLVEAGADLRAAEDAKLTARAAQLRVAMEEMKRELAVFSEIPQFDSAARLRLAGAYFQLQRNREACLILDQMVRQMEPDAVVESATASLMRGWVSLERHARSVRTAEMYLERCKNLTEKPNLPEVMFLRAQAMEGLFEHRKAADAYTEVATGFPKHEIAPRAEFMAAYNILQLEEYAQAGAMLDRQLKKLGPKDEMWTHVVFWRAMAHYFAQSWEQCRVLLAEYLAEAGRGADPEYVDDALFRMAFSHFSEAHYAEAIRMLKDFEQEHPASEWLPEALLALGDCYGAEGELDLADAAYARIPVEASGFHDESWMKRGNIRKARKDLAGMKEVYGGFLEKRPQSPRISEALQWLGWVAKQEGNPHEARRMYWDAIERFGNDRVRPGLEEIFLALQGLYPKAELAEWESRMTHLLSASRDGGRGRFATRAGWALAQFHGSAKGGSEGLNPEQRAARMREDLTALLPQIDPKETAPRILADVADALADSGQIEPARHMYDGLRKWWPRSPERDRAFAGLGFLAVKAVEEDKAMDYFERYERTSVMPKSATDENGVALIQGELGGKVALAKAALVAKSKPEQAMHILLAVQKSKAMPTRQRADAFLQAAQLHVSKQRYRESLPYFEQIYILFNRYPDLVAEAYYGRGEALEKLGMNEKAREVYSEAANRSDLSSSRHALMAAERARALGGILDPKPPEGSVLPPKPDSP